MNARQQAEKDIKECLRKEGKAFIAFRTELNSVMRKIVSSQLREQKSWCLNHWAKKEA